MNQDEEGTFLFIPIDVVEKRKHIKKRACCFPQQQALEYKSISVDSKNGLFCDKRETLEVYNLQFFV